MEFIKHLYSLLLKLDKKTLVIGGGILITLLVLAIFIPQVWFLIAGLFGLSTTQVNKDEVVKIVKEQQEEDEKIEQIKEEGQKKEIKAKTKAEQETVDWLDGDF